MSSASATPSAATPTAASTTSTVHATRCTRHPSARAERSSLISGWTGDRMSVAGVAVGQQLTIEDGALPAALAETATPSVRQSACASPAVTLASTDRVALAGIEAALVEARRTGDARPPLAVIASLTDLAYSPGSQPPSAALLVRGRDEWLRRVRSAGRSESALRAYRIAIDDLCAWAQRTGRFEELFQETAIVDYLDDYRTRRSPAAATYHRRFLLLRRFLRWLSHREGVPDPFAELEAPPKPRHQGDWLTTEEFAALLKAADRPSARWPAAAARDRLVLIAFVTTGLRRSEPPRVRRRPRSRQS